jgi:hypothetical protein
VELGAGASAVLQNDTGTVRLENALVGRTGPSVFVPEASALQQLVPGAGLLALVWSRRRR